MLTSEQIREGNILIDTYHTGRVVLPSGTMIGKKRGMPKQYENYYNCILIEKLNYHYSPDALFPVVAQLEALGFDFEVAGRNNIQWNKIRDSSENKKMSLVSFSRQIDGNGTLSPQHPDYYFKTIYYNKPSEKIEAIFLSVVALIQYIQQQQEPEFISVQERLPSEPGWYKIKTIHNFISDAPYVHTAGGEMRWVVPHANAISHWRELTELEQK